MRSSRIVVDQCVHEIRTTFGVVPRLWAEALERPRIFEPLWLASRAYFHSTLPNTLRESILVRMARYCEVDYCLALHGCFLAHLMEDAEPLRPIFDASPVSFSPSLIARELALPPVKIHCSVLAEDAIKAAIADYRKKKNDNS